MIKKNGTTVPGAQVTVVIPSMNQGQFLDEALRSVFSQELPIEVFLQDGGSTDETGSIIERWAPKLTGWSSGPDSGQAAAINAGMLRGQAPYVCWLNSDDILEPGGLNALKAALDQNTAASVAYGRTWDHYEENGTRRETWVEPFSDHRLATRCIVSQPGTLIRRQAWEALGGLDEDLYMALDYDLWWRIRNAFGPLHFVDQIVATNRIHNTTKSNLNRRRHYREAMTVVRKHYGRLPLKWWLAQPYKVWMKSGFKEW